MSGIPSPLPVTGNSGSGNIDPHSSPEKKPFNGREFAHISSENPGDLKEVTGMLHAESITIPSASTEPGGAPNALAQLPPINVGDAQEAANSLDALGIATDMLLDESYNVQVELIKDPKSATQEQVRAAATSAAANLYVESDTRVSPPNEPATQTMIVVNEHPIFFQKGGPLVVVGNVQHVDEEKAKQEVVTVLEAALHSSVVHPQEKEKTQAALQENDVRKLSVGETKEAFAEIPEQRAQMQAIIREHIPGVVQRMTTTASATQTQSINDSMMKIERSSINDKKIDAQAGREAWTQKIRNKMTNPKTSKQEVHAYAIVAHRMFLKHLNEDKEILRREYKSGATVTWVRGRLIISSKPEERDSLIKDIEHDDSLSQNHKKTLMAHFKAENYEQLSQEDLEFATARADELSKEISDWIEKRIHQLQEESRKEETLVSSRREPNYPSVILNRLRQESDESISLCVLPALCMKDGRQEANQQQKAFIVACMEHDRAFEEEMKALNKNDRENKKRILRELDKRTQRQEHMNKGEIRGQEQRKGIQKEESDTKE